MDGFSGQFMTFPGLFLNLDTLKLPTAAGMGDAIFLV